MIIMGNKSLRKVILKYFLLISTLIILFISIFDYYNSKNELLEKNRELQASIESNITNSLFFIHDGYLMVNEVLNKSIKPIMNDFTRHYKKANNITDMNIEMLKNRYPKCDFYIINREGVVIKTTYKKDYMLDFKNYQSMYDELMEIFKTDKIHYDIITPETQTGKLRKYTYKTSYDDKYILEIGLSSSYFEKYLNNLSYVKASKQIENNNSILKNVRIMNTRGYILNAPEKPVSKITRKFVDRTAAKKKSIIRQNNENEKIKYLYLGLKSDRYPSDSSKIIELTYNNKYITNKLKKNRLIHFLFFVGITLILIPISYFISSVLSSPIKNLIGYIKNMSEKSVSNMDRLNSRMDIKELDILQGSVNKFLRKIKQEYEEIREAQNKLKIALKNSNSALWEYNFSRKEFNFSENITNITGLEIENITNKKFLKNHLYSSYIEDIDNLIKKIKKEGIDSFDKSIKIKIEDNFKWFLIRAKIERLNESNEKVLIGTITDITKRKKIDNFLQQSQKMESLGKLAGGIAHDFKNIVAGIKGYTDIYFQNDKKEKCDHYIEKIRDLSIDAKKLSEKILDYSKKTKNKVKEIDINKLLHEVINMLKGNYSNKVKKISLNLESDINLIQADPSQIKQVFMNIVINSFDAIDKNKSEGKIEITTQNITDTHDKYFLEGSRDYVLVTVEDNGRGIEEDIQYKIFEPFFSTKKESNDQGTGLGLSTTHSIIENHNGFLNFKSKKNTGTIFYIYLPVSQN